MAYARMDLRGSPLALYYSAGIIDQTHSDLFTQRKTTKLESTHASSTAINNNSCSQADDGLRMYTGGYP